MTYDIADTEGAGAKRLRRIADVCLRYGQRVQFSVFECRVSKTQLARLLGEVEDVIDPEVDSVRVYRFPGRVRDATLEFGRRGDHALGEPWLV